MGLKFKCVLTSCSCFYRTSRVKLYLHFILCSWQAFSCTVYYVMGGISMYIIQRLIYSTGRWVVHQLLEIKAGFSPGSRLWQPAPPSLQHPHLLILTSLYPSKHSSTLPNISAAKISLHCQFLPTTRILFYSPDQIAALTQNVTCSQLETHK